MIWRHSLHLLVFFAMFRQKPMFGIEEIPSAKQFPMCDSCMWKGNSWRSWTVWVTFVPIEAWIVDAIHSSSHGVQVMAPIRWSIFNSAQAVFLTCHGQSCGVMFHQQLPHSERVCSRTGVGSLLQGFQFRHGLQGGVEGRAVQVVSTTLLKSCGWLINVIKP